MTQQEKEIREWSEHLIKMIAIYHSDEQKHMNCPLCGVNIGELADHMTEKINEVRQEAKREVLEEVLKKKTNYKIEKEEHGYRVTLEYVLVDDIEKELDNIKQSKNNG